MFQKGGDREVDGQEDCQQPFPRGRTLEVNKVIDKKMHSTAMARNCGGPVSSSHSSYSSLSFERDCPTAAISKIHKSRSTNSGYQMPNPIRARPTNKVQHHNGGESISNHFVKTKSHALKLYKELKKMKQPISPGGRIATLINSLFLAGHSKKAKYTNENDHQDHVGAHQPDGNNNKSTYSSASSFSRSCLSHKTSSSSASSTNKPQDQSDSLC